MPILHTQFSGQGITPNGQTVQLPPAVVLQQRGPCLQASVGLLQSMAQALIQQGDQVPAPRAGVALIDTGASDTCIEEQTARDLGLPVVDQVTMASASQSSSPRNVYPITIEITGLPFPMNAPRAIGAELAPQGLILLIGRDALQFCTLFYNGITGEITLSV